MVLFMLRVAQGFAAIAQKMKATGAQRTAEILSNWRKATMGTTAMLARKPSP
jgi:hypothetical protein